MSLSGIKIRAVHDSDIPAILSLLRHCLGEGEVPWTRDHWKWKHQDNPFGQSPVRVAVADGTIVGVRVFMRWDLVAGVDQIKCARPVDTATHPEWRRRGIFSELTRDMVGMLKTDGVSLIFNTPNDQSRPAYLGLGWSEVGRIRFAVKLVRPLRVLRARLLDKRENKSQKRSPRVAELVSSGAGQEKTAPVRNFLEESDARFFVERCCSPPEDRLSIPVSPDYIQWRYASIPAIDYYASWKAENENAALIIFRVTRSRTLTELRICEVFVDHSQSGSSVVKDLIYEAIEFCQPDYVLSVTSGGTPYRWQLHRMGFVPVPASGRILVARKLEGGRIDGLDAFDMGSWRLSLGSLEML